MPDDPLTKTERDKESADSAERMLFERMAITQSQARLHLATVAASVQSQNPIQLPQQTNQPIPIPTGVISATAFPPPPLTLGLQKNNPGAPGGGGAAPPSTGGTMVIFSNGILVQGDVKGGPFTPL